MPKISIYVPDDLKADMDQHQEINFSKVAQSAFRREMACIEKHNDVFQRALVQSLIPDITYRKSTLS